MPSKTIDQEEHAEQGSDLLATFFLCAIEIAYIIVKLHS